MDETPGDSAGMKTSTDETPGPMPELPSGVELTQKSAQDDQQTNAPPDSNAPPKKKVATITEPPGAGADQRPAQATKRVTTRKSLVGSGTTKTFSSTKNFSTLAIAATFARKTRQQPGAYRTGRLSRRSAAAPKQVPSPILSPPCGLPSPCCLCLTPVLHWYLWSAVHF